MQADEILSIFQILLTLFVKKKETRSYAQVDFALLQVTL